MCFGGGGGGGQSPAPNVTVNPMAPVVKNPEPPKQLTQEYKPLQPQEYQPGIQQAGSSQRRQTQATDRASLARRRGLSTGITLSGSSTPSGGINL